MAAKKATDDHTSAQSYEPHSGLTLSGVDLFARHVEEHQAHRDDGAGDDPGHKSDAETPEKQPEQEGERDADPDNEAGQGFGERSNSSHTSIVRRRTWYSTIRRSCPSSQLEFGRSFQAGNKRVMNRVNWSTLQHSCISTTSA